MIDLITVGAFLGIAVGVVLLGQLISGNPQRDRLQQRLEEEAFGGYRDPTSARRRAESAPAEGSEPPVSLGHGNGTNGKNGKNGNGKNGNGSEPSLSNKRQADRLTNSLAGLLPQTEGAVSELEKDLRRAGYHTRLARFEFQASRVALLVLALLATGGLFATSDLNNPAEGRMYLIVGGIAAVMAYALPRVYLGLQAFRRLQRIQKGLPDGLDMISMCITGGMSLPLALERVSREIYVSHPDLAVELEIVRQHTEFSSLEYAMRQFANRIDLPEVLSLSSLVAQSQRFGTNVVGSLQEFADGERRNLRQRADERANRVGFQLLFPVVTCLMPAIVLLLWGPAMLEVRDFINTQSVQGGALDQDSTVGGARASTVIDRSSGNGGGSSTMGGGRAGLPPQANGSSSNGRGIPPGGPG